MKRVFPNAGTDSGEPRAGRPVLLAGRRGGRCLLVAGVVVGLVTACRVGGERGEQPAPPPANGGAAATATEALAARLLEERYHLPEGVVAQAQREGSSLAEILVAANLSARAGRPLVAVLQARQQGQEWQAIARSYGLPEEALTQPAAPALPPADEARFRAVLEQQFRLPELTVAQLRRDGFSVVEILAAAALTGGGPDAVRALLYGARQGHGWQPVPGSPGARPQNTARPEGTTADEVAPYLRALLTDYYGLPAAEVTAAAEQGLPWSDLLVAANAAAGSGRPFARVVSWRAEGLGWSQIERRLGLDAGGALRLHAPKKR